MHNQEQLSQVRRLGSAGSKSAQGAWGPKAAKQTLKRRPPPPPSPPTASAAPQAEGGFGARSCHGKKQVVV